MKKTFEDFCNFDYAKSARKRVAVYCRVSTDKGDQNNSLESQKQYFMQLIEKEPAWELVEIYTDDGVTGTNTKKRRAFNHMMEAAMQGKIDLIITKEISRFARNTLDSVSYTRELRKHGVGVIFMNDNINTLDPDAELRLTIMASIAQEESRKTSERVKWGQKRRMEQGVVFGRSLLGYDVRNGRLFINENGAQVVRSVFDKFVNEKKGTHVIARELNFEGVKPMYCDEWSSTTVLRILRNEKYCGDLVQKKTYTPDYLSHEKKQNLGQEELIIIRNHHEPIISREVFNAAACILDSRAISQDGKAKYSDRHCFSGKIKCGKCGRNYVSRCRTHHDGSQHITWRCLEAARHGKRDMAITNEGRGCLSDTICDEDALQIMGLVVRDLELENTCLPGQLKNAIKKVVIEDFDDINADVLQRKIKIIEGKKARLLELYMEENISHTEFFSVREKYDAEIDRLQYEVLNSQRRKETKAILQKVFAAVDDLVAGIWRDKDFYRSILDHMVVNDAKHIDVYLKQTTYRWSFHCPSV